MAVRHPTAAYRPAHQLTTRFKTVQFSIRIPRLCIANLQTLSYNYTISLYSVRSPSQESQVKFQKPDIINADLHRWWPSGTLQKVPVLLTYATLYLGAFKIGMLLYFNPSTSSSLWPASGLALCTFLLFPNNSWVWFAVVQIVLHGFLSWSGHLPYTILISVASTAESLCGALILKKAIKNHAYFSHTAGVLLFITTCLFAALFSATIGAAAVASLKHTPVHYWTVFQHWALADFCGMLLFCPVLFHLFTNKVRRCGSAVIRESILFLLLSIGFTIYVFGLEMHHIRSITQSPSLIIPLLMWGAFRLPGVVTALALSLTGMIAALLSHRGVGPFNEIYHDLSETALGLQIFLSTTTGTILLLTAAVIEQKNMFLRVKKSQEGYQELVENAKTAIVTLDTSGNITFFNEYAESLFEYTTSEVFGKSVLETILPRTDHEGRDQSNMVQSFLGGLGPHYDVSNENENITKSGASLWMAWRNKAIFDSNGAFSGIMSVGLDISERHDAEKTLLLTNQRLKGILDSIDATVYVVDMQTHAILFVNELGKQQYGNVAGETCWKVLQKGQTAPCACCTPEKLPDSEGIPAGVMYREFQNEQSGRWFEMRKRVIPWIDGRMAQLLIVTDITDRKHFLESEQQHQEQLMHADKLKSLGVMVGSVAHAINNPVMFLDMGAENISSYLSAIRPALDEYWTAHPDAYLMGKRRDEIEMQILRILNSMHQGCARITAVIANLKQFARPDEGYLHDSVDLNAVVNSAINFCSEFIHKSTSCFSAELSFNMPLLIGNFQHLEQVVVNLITNAIQALSDRTQSITLQTGCEDDIVWLRVSDKGCGIAPEHITRITDPFFTTKGDLGGTGIGMSVSKQIVDRHRGTITYSSAVGRGTTAELRLPAQEIKTEAETL